MPLNSETLLAMKEAAEKALRTPMWRMDSQVALDFEQFVNPTNVSALLTERDALEGRNERLSDLVRYCRHQLHDEGLLTDEEFASIVAQGPDSARRLEGYDSLRAEVERQAGEIERLNERWITRIITLCGDCGQRYYSPRDDHKHGIGKCSQLDLAHSKGSEGRG